MTLQAIAVPNIAQLEFDLKYISASEIMRDLSITRATLKYARDIKKLPEPISLNEGQVLIWERESVSSIIESWKQSLISRRGN